MTQTRRLTYQLKVPLGPGVTYTLVPLTSVLETAMMGQFDQLLGRLRMLEEHGLEYCVEVLQDPVRISGSLDLRRKQ